MCLVWKGKWKSSLDSQQLHFSGKPAVPVGVPFPYGGPFQTGRNGLETWSTPTEEGRWIMMMMIMKMIPCVFEWIPWSTKNSPFFFLFKLQNKYMG